MPLSFWFLVHMDIELTPYLPYVDNGGHLTNYLPHLVHVVYERPLWFFVT